MKKVLALVLAVFIFGGSALAFAWWDQLDVTEDVTITVGQGVTLVSTELTADTVGGNLVPDSAVMKVDDVTQAAISYQVTLDDTYNLQSDLNVNVTLSGLSVSGSGITVTLDQEDLDNLENIILFEILIDGDAVTGDNFALDGSNTVEVTVNVTFKDDPTASEILTFNKIKNGTITYNVLFTASQTIVE